MTHNPHTKRKDRCDTALAQLAEIKAVIESGEMPPEDPMNDAALIDREIAKLEAQKVKCDRRAAHWETRADKRAAMAAKKAERIARRAAN